MIMENMNWNTIPIIIAAVILGLGCLIGRYFKKKK